MPSIQSQIQYTEQIKIGKVTAKDGDEYTIGFDSTGGSITSIKSTSEEYMVGDTVMVNRQGRNLYTIMCLSPYA